MAVVPFSSSRQHDAYAAGHPRLVQTLLQYTLIDSYDNFVRHGQSFPFVDRASLLPSAGATGPEYHYQNTALVIMLDNVLPRSLVKHFRIRQSNRVIWRNIQRLAPQPDLTDYKTDHCRLSTPEGLDLLRKLAAVDYALLIETPEPRDEGGCMLTHMHVKVERLTDNAIKDLAKSLGYIDRRLFERGEDYVDALEAKFFEYYGFGANASGRKSAAAMAAQLLATHKGRFSVFVAGQEDPRLTILDQSDQVTQYLLVRLDAADEEHLNLAARAQGAADLNAYTARHGEDGAPVVLYRARLRRPPAALGAAGGSVDRSLNLPWLEIVEEFIVPPPSPSDDAPPLAPLPFAWATRS